jgi:hypothetical protein
MASWWHLPILKMQLIGALLSKIGLINSTWTPELLAHSGYFIISYNQSGCLFNVFYCRCDTVTGTNGQTMWRGLRVRMAVHTGVPNCEIDRFSGRMTYVCLLFFHFFNNLTHL